ncbi:MAG: hypothetical protein EZS28_029784, partial [Streblomastix strix]
IKKISGLPSIQRLRIKITLQAVLCLILYIIRALLLLSMLIVDIKMDKEDKKQSRQKVFLILNILQSVIGDLILTAAMLFLVQYKAVRAPQQQGKTKHQKIHQTQPSILQRIKIWWNGSKVSEQNGMKDPLTNYNNSQIGVSGEAISNGIPALQDGDPRHQLLPNSQNPIGRMQGDYRSFSDMYTNPANYIPPAFTQSRAFEYYYNDMTSGDGNVEFNEDQSGESSGDNLDGQGYYYSSGSGVVDSSIDDSEQYSPTPQNNTYFNQNVFNNQISGYDQQRPRDDSMNSKHHHHRQHRRSRKLSARRSSNTETTHQQSGDKVENISQTSSTSKDGKV